MQFWLIIGFKAWMVLSTISATAHGDVGDQNTLPEHHSEQSWSITSAIGVHGIGPPPGTFRATVRDWLQSELWTAVVPQLLRIGALSFTKVYVLRLCWFVWRRGQRQLQGRQAVIQTDVHAEVGNPSSASYQLLPEEGPQALELNFYLDSDWNETCRELGFDTRSRLSTCLALQSAAAHLIFWHWLQPMYYFIVYWVYSDSLFRFSWLLWFCAWGVLIRELLYFLCACSMIWLCPGLLLWSPIRSASWSSLFIYAFMPEKLVLVAVVERHVWNDEPNSTDCDVVCAYLCRRVVLFIIWVAGFGSLMTGLDCFGAVGLFVAYRDGVLEFPLLAAWMWTTVSLICMVMLSLTYGVMKLLTNSRS